jgi:phosphatidylserine/phosphatidylglycerophosphate/cardiolipin synthase-like enzyme
VWSDLDVRGSRDTAVVAHELFREARHYVLLSTYNLGHRRRENDPPGHPVLRPLAERMAAIPGLRVRLFANLRRMSWQTEATEPGVIEAFGRWFRSELWPWPRLPEVYFDPRSLHGSGEDTACLHAKCIVVDDERAFVTSANLTEAAQLRNIEAGVLLQDASFARALRLQLEALINREFVRRLFISNGKEDT